MRDAGREFAYVRHPREAGATEDSGGRVRLIDARPAAQCAVATLAGARCLPADELFAPGGRLPAARDLLWLLGTAGLTGAETVVVVGQDVASRDAVAGVLHAAGQRRVRIATEPVARLLAAGAASAPGVARDFARRTVFTAPMRDDRLVLHHELLSALPHARLIDGRATTEYWGERARAPRSGHLPGAIGIPADTLRAALGGAGPAPLLPSAPAVAYAHDAREGFALLALLVAGFDADVRLYADGWARWASDGALPIDAPGHGDAEAYGAARVAADAGQTGATTTGRSGTAAIGAGLAAAAIACAAFGAGWWLARRRTALAR